MRILIILILTILANYIFKKVIEFINSKDENIVLRKRDKIIIISSYLIFITMFLIKYSSSLIFVFYYLTILYLIITAFIDFKTQYVYCILNIYMGINSAISLLYLLITNVDITPNISGVLITCIVSIILSRLDVWGWGDTEIFMVISPIVATGGAIYIIWNFIISMVLSSVINISNMLFKGFKMPLRQAFAPYITVSSLLIMFVK